MENHCKGMTMKDVHLLTIYPKHLKILQMDHCIPVVDSDCTFQHSGDQCLPFLPTSRCEFAFQSMKKEGGQRTKSSQQNCKEFPMAKTLAKNPHPGPSTESESPAATVNVPSKNKELTNLY